jgi:predicted nucleic acid-binding protein
VRLIIADTGPVNYLILIGNIDLLPALFDKVILPSAVQAELTDPDAPPSVRNWIAYPPAWLHVHETPSSESEQASLEDEGETATIALAISLNADLLLMNDRRGVIVARGKGLRVTGTLGVLDLAAQRGLVNFAQAIDRLRRTTFRIPEALLDSLVKRHAQQGGDA